MDASGLYNDAEAKPGGRHDNDHVDHREISIMPTADELLSKDRPFFRTADFIDDPKILSSRHGIHLDNQFRLLGEDMLADIRDELKVLTSTKAGRHKGIAVDGVFLAGVEMGTARNRLPWGVVLKCKEELPCLKKSQPYKRKDFLKDNRVQLTVFSKILYSSRGLRWELKANAASHKMWGKPLHLIVTMRGLDQSKVYPHQNVG